MRRVFVNPSGQRENLGDSVLRRAYIDSLRPLGQLHVLAGRHEGYASALGLAKTDRVYASKAKWLLNAFISCSVFAVNAGEIVTARRYALNFLWQAALAWSVKRRRGKTIMLGASLREHPTTTRLLLKWLVRKLDSVSWRDAEAQKELGRCGDAVQPDWAVMLGLSDASLLSPLGDRESCVISLRGDRPLPSEQWFSVVRRSVELLEVSRLVVVVQVFRDRDRAHEIAAKLDAEVVDWPDGRSHADHERVIRTIFRASKCVISDRIHALIIGLTEGAVPVGLSTDSRVKIEKTFMAIAPTSISALPDINTETVDDSARAIHRMINNPQELFEQVVESREFLRRHRDGIVRSIMWTQQ